MGFCKNYGFLMYLGILSIIVSVGIIPVSMLDPAISGLVAWLAIVLGGFSSIGIHSNLRYCIASILISLTSVFALTIYTKKGLEDVSMATFVDVFLIMAIPLILAILFVAVGFLRRKKLRF